MSDPFGRAQDRTRLFPAMYPGTCEHGCDIIEGDMIAYVDDDLLCETCYHEVRGT